MLTTPKSLVVSQYEIRGDWLTNSEIVKLFHIWVLDFGGKKKHKLTFNGRLECLPDILWKTELLLNSEYSDNKKIKAFITNLK